MATPAGALPPGPSCGSASGTSYVGPLNVGAYDLNPSFDLCLAEFQTGGGTLTVASGVTSVDVLSVGGGGGGGGAYYFAGGGGGGGGEVVACTNDHVTGTIDVTVGTGGAGGTNAPTSGSNGGASSVTGLNNSCAAQGGGGGLDSILGTTFYDQDTEPSLSTTSGVGGGSGTYVGGLGASSLNTNGYWYQSLGGGGAGAGGNGADGTDNSGAGNGGVGVDPTGAPYGLLSDVFSSWPTTPDFGVGGGGGGYNFSPGTCAAGTSADANGGCGSNGSSALYNGSGDGGGGGSDYTDVSFAGGTGGDGAVWFAYLVPAAVPPLTPTVSVAPSLNNTTNGANQTIIASWPAVSGATSYTCTLMYGYNNPSSFTVTSTSPTCAFSGLSSTVGYGVQVVANGPGGSSAPGVAFASAPVTPSSSGSGSGSSSNSGGTSTHRYSVTVYFAMGSSTITSADLSRLKSVERVLKGVSGAEIEIVGWVQPTSGANTPSNQLATARARSTARALRSLGVVGNYSITAGGLRSANVASSRFASVTVTW